MIISNEQKETIKSLFEDNATLRDELLEGSGEAIVKLGIISQEPFKAQDIIAAYQSNALEEMYQKAQKLVKMQALYRELYRSYEMQQAMKSVTNKSR